MQTRGTERRPLWLEHSLQGDQTKQNLVGHTENLHLFLQSKVGKGYDLIRSVF